MARRSLQDIPDERRCTARSKGTGERCKRWATPGSSVCRFHGGKTPRGAGTGAPIKHGLYSKYRASLAEITEEMYAPDVWDELALTRALLHRFLDQHDIDEVVKSPQLVRTIIRLGDQVRRLVGTMRKPAPQVSALTVEVEDTDILDLLTEVIVDVLGPEAASAVLVELQARLSEPRPEG